MLEVIDLCERVTGGSLDWELASVSGRAIMS
jgi:hypothetical protein